MTSQMTSNELITMLCPVTNENLSNSLKYILHSRLSTEQEVVQLNYQGRKI